MEPLKVLFIDDNRDFVTVNCTMLELYGYQTIPAFTGAEGIAKAEACSPDVIVCDIGLPDIDGYRVAAAVRNSQKTKNCYLISLSGYARADNGQAAKNAGFDLHAVKPADIMALISSLKQPTSKSNENC